MANPTIPFDEIDVADVTIEQIRAVTLFDLYEYFAFLVTERKNDAKARARKVASLRSFFNYLEQKERLITENPAKNLESPKIGKTLPRHLDLDSSIAFLQGIKNARDYAIFTLLLNCGLRVSELTSINTSDIRGDTLIIKGKGNKERTIYLNDSCQEAVRQYLAKRPGSTENALFLNHLGKRLGSRGVQLLVKKYLDIAHLDTVKYSTHKLRHTAATLMYKHGNVDIRTLQQLLGHESIATTEIYTHVDQEQLREASKRNPLSEQKNIF